MDALSDLGVYARPFTKNLSVFFDSALNFEKQISSVVKASFCQLRILAKVKPYLPRKEFECVIHAFITSRLDYCNSLCWSGSVIFASFTVSPKCSSSTLDWN